MSVTPERVREALAYFEGLNPSVETDPLPGEWSVPYKGQVLAAALREAQEQRDRFKNALIGIDAVTTDDHAREIALDALAASVPADEEQA